MDGEQISDYQSLGKRVLFQKGSTREYFGMTELLCILIMVIFTWLYAFAKIHRIVYQKE